jgi:enoyl-CoA hydratase
MNWKNITLRREGKSAVVTVNRPEKLNALDSITHQELQEAFTGLDADKTVRTIIVTGSGKAFVSGADIAEMRSLTPEEARRFSRLGHQTMDLIQDTGKPVNAAVNGYALGGGAELALACDIIYACEEALFGMPETILGIIPGWAGTQRLPRLVGKAITKELIFSGAFINARRAYEIGLVNRVLPLPELMPEVMKLADSIAEKGPTAIKLAKGVINRGCETTLAEGCAMETEAFVQCCRTPDREIGMQAFLEKRKPVFEDR